MIRFSRLIPVSVLGFAILALTPSASTAQTYTTLYGKNVLDVVFSQNGQTAFASIGGGQLISIDVSTRAVTHNWLVGNSLGGIDISLNGQYLYAAEQQTINNGAQASIRRLDIGTGLVSTASFNTAFYEGGAFDVAAMADGKILFTTDFLGSGWTPLRTVEFGSNGNIFKEYGTVRQKTAIDSNNKGTHFLLGESNISDARLDIFTIGSGITSSHSTYSENHSGFNVGMQAFSSEGNLAAHYIYNYLPVYNSSLGYKFDLIDLFPSLRYNVSGMTFSADGNYLYVMSKGANSISAFETRNWTIKSTFNFIDPLPDPRSAGDPDWTSKLISSPDSNALAVIGKQGLYYLKTGLGAQAAVPEPVTWMYFVFGFGFVGHAVRGQRRKPVYTQPSA